MLNSTLFLTSVPLVNKHGTQAVPTTSDVIERSHEAEGSSCKNMYRRSPTWSSFWWLAWLAGMAASLAWNSPWSQSQRQTWLGMSNKFNYPHASMTETSLSYIHKLILKQPIYARSLAAFSESLWKASKSWVCVYKGAVILRPAFAPVVVGRQCLLCDGSRLKYG